MADPIRQLEEDHERVQLLAQAFTWVTGDAERRGLAARLGEVLRVHAAVAGEIFYPALARRSPPGAPDLVARAGRGPRAHAVQAALLTRLLGEAVGDGPAAPATQLADRLRALVLEHAQEERTGLFPAARQCLGTDLERLGELLARRGAELQVSAAPLGTGSAAPRLAHEGVAG